MTICARKRRVSPRVTLRLRTSVTAVTEDATEDGDPLAAAAAEERPPVAGLFRFRVSIPMSIEPLSDDDLKSKSFTVS